MTLPWPKRKELHTGPQFGFCNDHFVIGSHPPPEPPQPVCQESDPNFWRKSGEGLGVKVANKGFSAGNEGMPPRKTHPSWFPLRDPWVHSQHPEGLSLSTRQLVFSGAKAAPPLRSAFGFGFRTRPARPARGRCRQGARAEGLEGHRATAVCMGWRLSSTSKRGLLNVHFNSCSATS